MTTARETTADELVAIVGDSVSDADLVRARALASLVDVRQARLDGLRDELELRRAADPSDPALADLQARLALDELTVRALDGEAIRTADQPTAPGAGEAVVGGRVVPETGSVPRGARVELRDASDRPVAGVDTELDRSGGFRVRVPAQARRKLTGPVSVVVVNAKDEVIARHPETLDPAALASTYREIPLAPAAIRVLDESAGLPGAAAVARRRRSPASGAATAPGTRSRPTSKPTTAPTAAPSTTPPAPASPARPRTGRSQPPGTR